MLRSHDRKKQERETYQTQAEIIITGLKLQDVITQKQVNELNECVKSIIKSDKRDNSSNAIRNFVANDLTQLKEKAEIDLHIKKQFIIASDLVDKLCEYLTPEAISDRYKTLDLIFNRVKTKNNPFELNIYVKNLKNELKNAETIFHRAMEIMECNEKLPEPTVKPIFHYSIHKGKTSLTIALFYRQSSSGNTLIEKEKKAFCRNRHVFIGKIGMILYILLRIILGRSCKYNIRK